MDFLPFGLTAILYVIIAVINHKKDYKRYGLLIGLTAAVFLVLFYYEQNFGRGFNAKDCLIMAVTLIFGIDFPLSIKENNKNRKKV